MDVVGRNIGAIAIAYGVVGFASVASLGLMFAVPGPFGSINDWSIGVMGVLCVLLALGLGDRETRATEDAAIGPWTVVAVVGSVIVVLGAGLVISRTTGFMLAGLVESLGFAIVGVWLAMRARGMSAGSAWPRRLPLFGLVTGIVMATGFAVAPAIAARVDDLDTAPAYVWIGFIGWLGIFFLFPAWSIWLGRAARSRAL